MPSLLEIQRRMRDAVVADEAAGALLPLLAGGRDPRARLAIHRHHYQASLTGALLDKFPAVSWLAGERFATAAAQAFVRAHPPAAPCIAEYGADYPAFLASCAGAERLPYLRAFAELERYAFFPAEVHLETRGGRGEFSIERLAKAEFVFRSAIVDGGMIGAAAEHALDINAAFDPGQALLRLVSAGLVIAIDNPETDT